MLEPLRAVATGNKMNKYVIIYNPPVVRSAAKQKKQIK
jgi:hypothetical protein